MCERIALKVCNPTQLASWYGHPCILASARAACALALAWFVRWQQLVQAFHSGTCGICAIAIERTPDTGVCLDVSVNLLRQDAGARQLRLSQLPGLILHSASASEKGDTVGMQVDCEV